MTPLPQILKNNGYHTILCGKAHFGAINTPGENPYHLGFDVNIAGHAGGGIASYLGEENFGNKTDGTQSTPQAVPGLEKYWGKDIFATEALTLEAIQSLDKACFTVSLSFYTWRITRYIYQSTKINASIKIH